jgi:glutathione synthase/RimK-type ligase-like ATP-grasp enzyme
MEKIGDDGLQINRFFITAVTEWVAQQGGTYERCFGDWLIHIELNGVTKDVVWYDLGLNTSTQYMTMKDKAATSWVLQKSGVPTAEHFLLLRKDSQGWTPEQNVLQAAFIERAGFPIVVKPNGGSNGTEVYLSKDVLELDAKLTEMFVAHRAIALSPFITVQKEYRVTVLDGEVILVYAKVQDVRNDFRFNLSHGATVEEVSAAEYAHVAPLAQRALVAIGARFANIDIILDDKNDLRVLEINGGVAFEKYSQLSSEHCVRAQEVYNRALAALFR